MRLAVPVRPIDTKGVLERPNSDSRPVGWKYLAQLGNTEVAISSKMLQKCPHCQAPAVRLPPGVEGTVVGKSMVMSEVELRSFQVKRPMNQDTAADYGPEAREAWAGEAKTPPLDLPPVIVDEAEVRWIM